MRSGRWAARRYTESPIQFRRWGWVKRRFTRPFSRLRCPAPRLRQCCVQRSHRDVRRSIDARMRDGSSSEFRGVNALRRFAQPTILCPATSDCHSWLPVGLAEWRTRVAHWRSVSLRAIRNLSLSSLRGRLVPSAHGREPTDFHAIWLRCRHTRVLPPSSAMKSCESFRGPRQAGRRIRRLVLI